MNIKSNQMYGMKSILLQLNRPIDVACVWIAVSV